MACIKRRFFGVPIVEDAPPDLAESWGGERSGPGILFFADHIRLLRCVVSRRIRTGLSGATAAVVPLGRVARRQVRLACGCDVGVFSPFHGPIRILSRAEIDQAAVFIVDTEATAVRLVEQNVKDTFPGLRIVGRAVFSPAIADSVSTAIRKAAPRVVLIGSARISVLSWVISQYTSLGNVVMLLAEDAVARTAGHRWRFNPWNVPVFLLRLTLVPAAVLAHRIGPRWRRSISRA